MNQDSVERDRLLTRLDTNVTFLVDSQKNITQSLVDHARTDDTRFSKIDDTLNDIQKFRWKSTAAVGTVLVSINIAVSWAISWFHK